MKINVGKIFTNFLFCVIFVLLSLIFVKCNDSNKLLYKKLFFEDTFSFNQTRNWYKKYFGQILPEKTITVLANQNDDIYSDYEKYADGFKFKVVKNTAVSSLNGGIIIFKGSNDNYKDAVIIQGVDGYDFIYEGITTQDFGLYDYINKGDILGLSSDDYFILTIKKGNEIVDFETYKN